MSDTKIERTVSFLSGLAGIATFAIYIIEKNYKIINFSSANFISIFKGIIIVIFLEACITIVFSLLQYILFEKNIFMHILGLIAQYCSCSLSTYLFFDIALFPKRIIILILFVPILCFIKIGAIYGIAKLFKKLSWLDQYKYEYIVYSSALTCRFYFSFVFFMDALF